MKQDIHIGKIIKTKFQENGISITKFAELLHYERTNVYNIFNRKSINIETLIAISEILDYDFISEVYLDKKTKKFNINIQINSDMEEKYFLDILKDLEQMSGGEKKDEK